MEKGIALLDTSILIDYFRKKDKSNAYFFHLADNYSSFCISAITEYEIYSGTTPKQLNFWNDMLSIITVIPFGSEAVKTAVEINNTLKHKRKQIDIADLFIAATAASNNLPLATLNRKHFERVDTLKLVQV